MKLFKSKLVLILCLAAFLRLFFLDRVPPSLNWDEISMGYTAYSLGETGRDEWGEKLPLFFRSYGEWKSPVYIYLTVPFVQIFGLNAWGIRLPSALAGILAVYLTYLIGRKIYDEKTGLWAAFFLSVTPWHLVLSRPAFEANVSLTLILAGIYFFLRYISHQTLAILSLSSLFFGLAPHTYNSAKIVVPVLCLYLLYLFRKSLSLKSVVLFLGILAVFAAPILFNLGAGVSQRRFAQVGLLSDWNTLSQFNSYRVSSPLPPALTRLIVNKYTYFTYTFAKNYVAGFDPAFLVFTGGTHNQYRVPFHGILFLTEFTLLIYGIFVLFTRSVKSSVISHQPLIFLPLTLILIGFIPPAATVGSHHVLRSILTLPGWQLLAALGVVSLQNFKFPYLKIVYWLLSIEILAFTAMYFLWYPTAHARDWQWGYRQAIEYTEAHQEEYDRIVFTKWYGEPQLFLAFYGKYDPVAYQRANKLLLEYEKSPDKLWVDQLDEYSIGKYTFKYIDWVNEVKDGRTLFVGKPDDFWPDSNYKAKINNPDGTGAFYIVAE